MAVRAWMAVMVGAGLLAAGACDDSKSEAPDDVRPTLTLPSSVSDSTVPCEVMVEPAKRILGSLKNPQVYDELVLNFKEKACMFFSDPPVYDDEMVMSFWLVGPEVLDDVKDREGNAECETYPVPRVVPASSSLTVRCGQDPFSVRVYLHGGDATLTCSLHTPFELQPRADDLPELCVDVMDRLAASSQTTT